jgi:hypothetical protein
MAATLILRVWFEGNSRIELRARIVEVAGGSSGEELVATVATPEDLYAAVRSWVEQLTLH